MLLIEGGSQQQKIEEIEAYSPLIPKPFTIVVTLMFEIDDQERRVKALYQLGHSEDKLYLLFPNGTKIYAKAINDDIERTTPDGKTSSIHFLQFVLTPEQTVEFVTQGQNGKIIIGMDHENYSHMTIIPSNLAQAITQHLLPKP